ncbi:cobalamin-independent methionine synthase II family protein [Rhodoplanes sp. TEM]|uniref:Cobalamin-independent methionine synthase II family protein n=1 Tax=Rhodoplanes tepidamans TaxID=200616 RepID=A0ABT5JIK0_RHOTP|nr:MULTISPECIES: cobalamin-independent methionine synthase II family protein [Rhodoplanes]MDC7789389.1 cobalamin-independent methionine synthase II family protein [Rhodoplanes tepidamans]MDC7984517.1 cobalamin-independent methionine synthase II family protein [Rhodoplanes sp. TEM]MDQ0357926.1 5-methyltetrahydropteroyltriglutamate--homocysteine methyltransferase [Rhodoplanes tepidamans]
MSRTRPPFRADQVGSLLRPAALKEARARFQAGEIPADELKRVEDEEIRRIIRKQEEIGLQAVTDGEFRRSWWHFDFLKALDGVEGFEAQAGIQFHGVQTRAEGVRVTGRVGFSDHPMLEHFKFLKANTVVTPKMTIPSPSVLHFRGGRKEISTTVYPQLDAFFDDLARAYKKAVKAFYDAGCRYLQFDDTVWAYLCSKEQLQLARDRGEEVEKLPRIYADVINHAIADRPHDMVITTHVCRGNFRSTWVSEGGYEPVAERLLAGIDYDGYFLEYDTERAGGFEPLRFLPKGKKIVVLGLVTSKTGTLEAADAVRRRIDEASKFVPLDQLALSPQCGFASTEEGNLLAEEEQWAKLAMIVDIARNVWG